LLTPVNYVSALYEGENQKRYFSSKKDSIFFFL